MSCEQLGAVPSHPGLLSGEEQLVERLRLVEALLVLVQSGEVFERSFQSAVPGVEPLSDLQGRSELGLGPLHVTGGKGELAGVRSVLPRVLSRRDRDDRDDQDGDTCNTDFHDLPLG